MKKIHWYGITKESLIISNAIIVGTALMGMSVMMLILHLDEGSEIFIPMGGMMMLFGFLFTVLIGGWQSEAQQFFLAVSMGETRKGFFVQYMVQQIIHRLINWAVIYGLLAFEELIGRALTSTGELGFRILPYLPWYTFIIIPIAATAFSMMMGGLGIKLGQNMRWVMIGTTIVFAIAVNRFTGSATHETLVLPPVWVFAAIGAVVVIAFYAIAAILMSKQEVRL